MGLLASKLSNTLSVWMGITIIGLGACYYTPQHKRTKAHPSYLSEAQAENLIQKRLARYGVKFISNMKLKRDGVEFVADGFDRDLRVGFEYLSTEGGDYEDRPGGNADGLTESELQTLKDRQQTFREYFLIVKEGPAEQVEEAVAAFIQDLYKWEVLKKTQQNENDDLFPKKHQKRSDLLPWETTSNLTKRRKQMERKEKPLPGADPDNIDTSWHGADEKETRDARDPLDLEEAPKAQPKENKLPLGKESKDTFDEEWDDEEDF